MRNQKVNDLNLVVGERYLIGSSTVPVTCKSSLVFYYYFVGNQNEYRFSIHDLKLIGITKYEEPYKESKEEEFRPVVGKEYHHLDFNDYVLVCDTVYPSTSYYHFYRKADKEILRETLYVDSRDYHKLIPIKEDPKKEGKLINEAFKPDFGEGYIHKYLKTILFFRRLGINGSYWSLNKQGHVGEELFFISEEYYQYLMPLDKPSPKVIELKNEKAWFGSSGNNFESDYFLDFLSEKNCGSLYKHKKDFAHWDKKYRLEIDSGRIVEEE